MENLKKLLNTLDDMRQYRPKKGFNRFENAIQRGWKYGLITAAVPFAALCLLALWHIFVRELSKPWIEVAAWCGLASQLIASLTLICPILLMIGGILFWQENMRFMRDAELEHDQRWVGQLGRYRTVDLKKAKQHLELKTKRLERRMGFFIEGDAKKFALFSLLILNHTIANMLTQGQWQTLLSTSFDSPISTQFITWSVAFLLGISVGAIVIRVITNRDAYRIELIEMTLATRNPKE